jgi:hypothetical protein
MLSPTAPSNNQVLSFHTAMLPYYHAAILPGIPSFILTLINAAWIHTVTDLNLPDVRDALRAKRKVRVSACQPASLTATMYWIGRCSHGSTAEAHLMLSGASTCS